MSDLPRYELVPSHDSSDSKSHHGPAHGDEEQGFYPPSAEIGTSSTSSGAAPSRICYSFKPEYPVPGKEEDVVGIRGTNKQVSLPFSSTHALPSPPIHISLRNFCFDTILVAHYRDRQTRFPDSSGIPGRADRVPLTLHGFRNGHQGYQVVPYAR